MHFVTVTWMDGVSEFYSGVPWCEATGDMLHLAYDLESHIIPLSNVRSWKVEKA